MKKKFYTLFIISLMFTTGCEDTFYDAYNNLTGPVESVALPKTKSIVVNTSEKINASVYPSLTENKKVTWTSADPLIASVDENGVVTARLKGGEYLSTTITVTTAEGGFTAQCTVTVVPVPIPIESITLPATFTVGKGSTGTLTPVVTPSNPTDGNLTWTSDNPAVATVTGQVNGSAIVSGVNNGTVSITVNSEHWGKSASCVVTVGEPSYTVTYNANYTGGPAVVSGGSYKAGVNFTVLGSSTFTRNHFVFTGWNTLANGTGAPYVSAAAYPMGTANITLYAQWNQVTFKVTYDGNSAVGGLAPTDANVYVIGNTVTVLGNIGTLVKSGSFIGWTENSNGSGTCYTADDQFAITDHDVTLYAKWHSSYYALGDTGPAGGKIFYIKGSYSSGWQYLEAAQNDLSEIGNPDEPGIDTLFIWAHAVQACNDMVSGGCGDWYLPSRDELTLLYNNRTSVGSFPNCCYWSSTLQSASLAIGRRFDNGTEGAYGTAAPYSLFVRPIRAF